MPDISVVIPAYNVGPQVEKCLRSVLAQGEHVLEVIVVDDGSTDDTAEQIKQFSSDARLVFIQRANAGVSAARNAGIELARGDFIAFVDSDDWLEPETYTKLRSAILREDADVAVCDYNLVYEDRQEEKYSGMRNEAVAVSGRILHYFNRYCACPRPNNYIWTRLYRSGMVKKAGVRFEQFRLGDDTLFNFKLLPHIKRAVNLSDALYNYWQRPSSNVYTVAKKENLATVYADTFESLESYYREVGFAAGLAVLPIHAYTRLRSVVFYSRLAGLPEEEIAKNIEEGFCGRSILGYLSDTAPVGEYAEDNGLSSDEAMAITQAMRAAAENPSALAGRRLP